MQPSTEHVIITGASQGIGAVIARSWSQSFPGTRMSLLARNETNLEILASECQARPSKHSFSETDEMSRTVPPSEYVHHDESLLKAVIMVSSENRELHLSTFL